MSNWLKMIDGYFWRRKLVWAWNNGLMLGKIKILEGASIDSV